MSQCSKCKNLILEPNTTYGINPLAVCRCGDIATPEVQIFNRVSQHTDEDTELYQKITDIFFNNGGVTKPMVDKLIDLITLHTQKAVKASRMSQEYFEANLLDGDDVNDCGGAMLSAENVWELIDEFNINISKGE